MRRFLVPGLVALACTILVPVSLQAQYLDPGSGSILIQVLIGGLVGIVAVLKLYWRKIRGLFGRRAKPDPDGA